MDIYDLKNEYRLTFAGDDFGHALEWWFSVAEELYNRDVELPVEWQYHHVPLSQRNEDTPYEAFYVKDIDSDVLLKFGKMLVRLMGYLKYREVEA